MKHPASPPVQPIITYGALVGRVVLRHRKHRGLGQNHLARSLGVSQSAYSRIELGQTTITLAQLRQIAGCLGLQPSALLKEADDWATQLQARGVQITDEKEMPAGALLVGLGILAALLSSK